MGIESWPNTETKEQTESPINDQKIIKQSKHGLSYAEGKENNVIEYLGKNGEKKGETNPEKIFAEAEEHIRLILDNINTAKKMYAAICDGGEKVDIRSELINWVEGDVEDAFFELRNRTKGLCLSMSKQLEAKGKGVAIENNAGQKNVLVNL